MPKFSLILVDVCRTEDEDLKLAMQLSKSMMEQEEQQMAEIMSTGPIDHTQDVSEEDQIQAAIAMSLSGGSQPKPGGQDMKRASAMPVQGNRLLQYACENGRLWFQFICCFPFKFFFPFRRRPFFR